MKKLKPGEWIILSRLGVYQLPSEPENASLKRWRSFSPFWWGVFQGLWQGLLQPELWDTYDDETRYQIIEHFFDETIEECAECPEPEPEPEPEPQTGGSAGNGAIITGALGLTIEELEGALMGTIMGIRWQAGKLQVQYFPCCDWVNVDGLSGVVQESGGSNPLTEALSGLINDPNKMLPKVGVPVLPPLGHNTSDAIRCSKATAMQDGWFDVMNDIRDLLLLVNLSNITSAEILLLMAGSLLSGGWAVAAILATAIAAYVNQTNIEDLQDEIQADYNDTAMREAIICTLTTSLSEGTEITAADLTVFESVWATESNPSSALRQIMIALPGGFLRDRMQELVSSTPCACDQYKPYGYINPGVSGGVINFAQMAHYSVTGSGNTYVIPGGADLAHLQNLPKIGTWQGGASGTFASAYAGQEGSPARSFGAAGVLYRCQETITLNNLRVVPVWGNTNYNIRTRLHYFSLSTNTWSAGTLATVGNNALNPAYVEWNSIAYANVDYIYLQIGAFISNSVTPVPTWSAHVLFSGEVNAIPFIDLKAGELLP